MSTNDLSIRKLKMLFIFPFLILPFLTLLFWSLGGGRGIEQKVDDTTRRGLNINIPDAQIAREKIIDKLSLYQQAEKDSSKKVKLEKSFQLQSLFPDSDLKERYADQRGSTDEDERGKVYRKTSRNASRWTTSDDPNEVAVRRKLDQLEKALQDANSPSISSTYLSPVNSYDNQVEELKTMMEETMRKNDKIDPELSQIDQMLEKILDIQHPSRVQERFKTEAKMHERDVKPVNVTQRSLFSDDYISNSKDKSFISNISNDNTVPQRFFGVGAEMPPNASTTVISAVVHETQVVMSGNTVRLRLTQDMLVQGKRIPAGTFLFGKGMLQGERLICRIESIIYHNVYFPVSLVVYDPRDGMEGIQVKGALSADVLRKEAGDAMQNVSLPTIATSLEAQAASSGIEATKQLLRRKARLIKITLKADHPVALIDKTSLR